MRTVHLSTFSLFRETVLHLPRRGNKVTPLPWALERCCRVGCGPLLWLTPLLLGTISPEQLLRLVPFGVEKKEVESDWQRADLTVVFC